MVWNKESTFIDDIQTPYENPNKNWANNTKQQQPSDSSKDNSTVAIENLVALLVDFRNQVLSVKGSYYYKGQDCSTDSSV